MNTYRPTWAEIDLKNLKFNYTQLKRRTGSKVKMLAAVKANAYGHGMLEVSKKLEKSGIDYLGVASMDEALVLRKEGIKTPILVLGVVSGVEEIKLALKLNITLTVADYRSAKIFNSCVKEKNKIKIHIKVDTGMGRLGIWHEQAQLEIMKIVRLNNLSVEGIYTHFPSADTDLRFTRKQVRIFQALISSLREKNIFIELAHAANSIAACKLPCTFLNMIRPGIMLYGIYPDEKIKKRLKLKPVLSLKTKISYLKEVAAGRGISYGRTYITKKRTKIATLPVGYADGYPRALSNKARVIINRKFFPVVGRVCMDQTMVDVGLKANVKINDIVTLIGAKADKIIRTEELALICRTIPYEITCWISSRVPRMFKNY